jgi:hypothetical protein
MYRVMFPERVSELVALSLDAVVVSVRDATPMLLCVQRNQCATLPGAALDNVGHKTFESGMRAILQTQTGVAVGYAEQLYSFGDSDRGDHAEVRQVSVTYLALVREFLQPSGAFWADVYGFLPWEDWRVAKPHCFDALMQHLHAWANTADRAERVRLCFACAQGGFDHERVLERFELLWEAGLVAEKVGHSQAFGQAMAGDYRRMLASALGRLRGKLKYRPVIFELLPESFTMLRLQNTVEALIGNTVHKQNFRRLIEQGGLLEPCGARVLEQRGRPAELFRFRHAVYRERPAPGVRVSNNQAKPLIS